MPWVKLAKKADIPEGQIRPFVAGDKKVALANVEGEFFAIDDVCTHAQCSLGEGTLINQEVECPCHGSRFDVTTGEVRFLPATVPVSKYNLRVEGEDLSVEI